MDCIDDDFILWYEECRTLNLQPLTIQITRFPCLFEDFTLVFSFIYLISWGLMVVSGGCSVFSEQQKFCFFLVFYYILLPHLISHALVDLQCCLSKENEKNRYMMIVRLDFCLRPTRFLSFRIIKYIGGLITLRKIILLNLRLCHRIPIQKCSINQLS